MARGLFVCGLMFCWVTGATESFVKGFVQTRSDQRLYVEHRKAEKGKPTLILLNGLTWKTYDWLTFVEALDRVSPGLGLILYDMEGQGQTLLDKAPITFDIPIEKQVRDLHDLLKVLDVGKVTAVGLSYGGGLAISAVNAHPSDFDQVIVMAPFLERLKDQDVNINYMVSQHRMLHPWDKRSDEELYDHYLRVVVYTTYYIAEPSMLENPFKNEAVYRMVKGIKNWRALDNVNKLGKRRFHILGGEEDPYVKDLELQGFWQNIPEASRASFVRLKGVKHKIPEIKPEFSAKWVKRILDGDTELFKGQTFEVDPDSEARVNAEVKCAPFL